MNQQATLRAQLRHKFDQLPVERQPKADWKDLKKALEIALPVSLIPLALQGKIWLTKKLIWLYLAVTAIGGGATAVIIYNSPKTEVAASAKSNRDYIIPSLAGQEEKAPKPGIKVLPAVKDSVTAPDTNGRIIAKRKTTPRVMRDSTIRPRKKSVRPTRDTVVRAVKARKIARSARDTTVQYVKRKTAQPRVAGDTVKRPVRKTYPPKVRDTANWAGKAKRATPPRLKGDTTVRPARKRSAATIDTSAIPLRKRNKN